MGSFIGYSVIGFTGTQQGMTLKQLGNVAKFLTMSKALIVHHGLCVGADGTVTKEGWF